MFKIAALIWMVLATTLGGMAVTAIVVTPGLAEQAPTLIPVAFLTAVILAMPLSYLIAKRIQVMSHGI
ncbi:MAG TPA: hypothetical protein PKD49_14205 [Hyphomicrobium sp.]|nr:hypothetical protein [Hyphomicrobium sp.]